MVRAEFHPSYCPEEGGVSFIEIVVSNGTSIRVRVDDARELVTETARAIEEADANKAAWK